MSVPPVRVSSGWLDLREPADAAARSTALVSHLLRERPTRRSWRIHDLGAGSGSMGRWLAPRLHGRQHWVLHDRDADLLAGALADPPGEAADRTAVTVEARRSNLEHLTAADLSDASLITASALLDMLTFDELAAMVDACVAAGCAVLITLSVTGRIRMTPPDPLDARLEAAFNAHQRRTTARGALLGPDAVALAAERFAAADRRVVVRPSPWRLDDDRRELARQWLRGWVQAACEQDPDLGEQADAYTTARLAQLADGRLTISVGHDDLLVMAR